MRFNQASNKQAKAARMFSDASETLTISQAMKYLDECFKLAHGEMSEEEFTKKTGHKPHTVRF